ncbi:hypothetical protein K488DRAFT_28613, partial [Vararia minispora EC-137]
GLFATTVASFLIFSLPSLSPDSGQQSADTLQQITLQLAQISQQLASPSSPSVSPPSPNATSPEQFNVPRSAVHVNILWTLSFFLSLCCALAATLVQQWSRRYLAAVQRRGQPRECGPVHAHLRLGVERFGMNNAVDVIISLLHIAVALFVSGLLDLLFSINTTVAYTLLAAFLAACVAYITLSVIPVFFLECPFGTP